MKLINKIWLAIMPALFLVLSCTDISYKKTKSGLEYKIFPGSSKGENMKVGEFVKFNYKITVKDSTIVDSYGIMPGFDIVDSPGRKYDFSEILRLMKVGDSAVTFQLFDSLLAANPNMNVPFMKKGDKLKTTIKILQVFKTRELVMANYQKEIDDAKNKQINQLKKYLSDNSIQTTEINGVFVEIKEKGTGQAIDSGKLVSIRYTGSNLEGKSFDSNIDSTKSASKGLPMEPFSFVAKGGGAIQGMTNGIMAFNKGGKGRLFIPSYLGYGPQGSPPLIKPNEHLIFYVEVVDVKDQPKQPENQPTMEQLQEQIRQQQGQQRSGN
jgi:FKBP-type peptidyl-prolyl cis-trans isomerase